jgi:N-acetylglutamate synthase-like GNAT family acetyltransferase
MAGSSFYGADALLRSVITVPEMRDRAYGVAIVDRMLALALRRGARTLYLLTTTAAPFFERLGFVAIDRAAVPPAIAGTTEFTLHCPATAVLMGRSLV